MSTECKSSTLVSTFFAEHHEFLQTVCYFDDPPPEAGDTLTHYPADWGTGQFSDKKPTGTYLQVPATLHGANLGTTWERSNYLALLQDYPTTFVQIGTDNDDTFELLLPYTDTIPDVLAEVLVRLYGYGLYDDDHHAQYEEDLVAKWWAEGCGREDFLYDLNMALTEGASSDFMDDLKITDEWIDEFFWMRYRHHPRRWEYESDGPFDAYIPDAVVQDILRDAEEQVVADWNAKVTWLTDRQKEGLF